MSQKVDTTDIDGILEKPYARVFIKERGGWSVSVREFKGCYAVGHDVETAMLELEAAMTDWVSEHDEVPEPISKGEQIQIEQPETNEEPATMWVFTKEKPSQDWDTSNWYRNQYNAENPKQKRVVQVDEDDFDSIITA